MTGNLLAPLSIDGCWDLLDTTGVARIAVCRDGDAPVVVPVNYAIEDRTILFRTGAGTKLTLLHERPIAFQLDHVDPVQRTGWSVLVRGVARVEERVCDDETQPRPWAGGAGRRNLIRLWPSSVTGRRLDAPEHEWTTRGYL